MLLNTFSEDSHEMVHNWVIHGANYNSNVELPSF